MISRRQSKTGRDDIGPSDVLDQRLKQPGVGRNRREASLNGGLLNGLPAQQQQQQIAAGAKLDDAREPGWWRRTRMHVALLGLAIAAVNCYAQATFCMAIVEMVVPVGHAPSSGAQTSGQQAAPGRHNLSAPEQSAELFNNVRDQDESCPIEYKYRHYYDSWRFAASNRSEPANSSLAATVASRALSSAVGKRAAHRFDWDASQQGLLLGAFAFGTAPLQVVGGRLAEIYGAKWVLLAGCIGTALTNLSIPLVARVSFALLLANRILMGVAQAGMEPGLMCLLADWLTPSEAGFFISMLLFAICLGFFLGSLLSSSILALGYGWPMAYYVSGGLNLAVGLVWLCYADSWPRTSRHISARELAHIHAEQAKARAPVPPDGSSSSSSSSGGGGGSLASLATSSSAAQANQANCALASAPAPQANKRAADERGASESAPWANILATRSVWAFIICKISIRWSADVLSNELPTYLANVLHVSIEINGLLNSASSALFAVCSLLTGWLVNRLDRAQRLGSNKTTAIPSCTTTTATATTADSKTALRKLFQSGASFGSALSVLLMTHYDCSLLVSMGMLLVLSCCLVMGTGGELQIPYDMTARYPGTLHGMACTLSVSGWLAPPLIGLILADRPSSRQRWRIVWYLTAAINLVGGLVFVLFADASPRDFDSKRRAPAATAYANSACSPASTCNNSPKLHQAVCFEAKPIEVVGQSGECLMAPSARPASASLSSLASIELALALVDKARQRQQLGAPERSGRLAARASAEASSANKAHAANNGAGPLASLWRRVLRAPGADITGAAPAPLARVAVPAPAAGQQPRAAEAGGARQQQHRWRADGAKTITHL